MDKGKIKLVEESTLPQLLDKGLCALLRDLGMLPWDT